MHRTHKAELFTDIVLEVFKLGGLLVNEGDQLTREFGTTSARWKILGAIALAGSPQTVPQIARSMGLTRQAVQRLVDVMHEDDLLAFQDNPEHKRAKLIGLTHRGKRIYAKLDNKQANWANTNASNITRKDLDVTLVVLKQISEQFRA